MSAYDTNRPLGAINRKYIFRVLLKTVSPLRIASGRTDNITDVLVLKNKDGQAFIPGTSVAGVLRNEIRKLYGENIARIVFGYSGNDNNGAQSMLAIDDVLLYHSKIITRDGVHIHEIAGTGVNKEKYNFEAVEKGAEGTLTMEMTVREGNEQEIQSENIIKKSLICQFIHSQYAENSDVFSEVAASLADLLTAGVHIGSLTAKGMGLIKSVEPANVYLFNFVKKAEETIDHTELPAAEAWLKFIEDGALPSAYYISDEEKARGVQHPFGDFVLDAEFAIKSSLLVRDAARVNDYKADKNSTLAGVPMKSGADYVIPGTGIKGALRGKAYKILMGFPKSTDDKIQLFLSRLMGWAKQENRNNEADNEGRKSKLFVDEVYFSEDGNIHEMKQSRNRIDRFTGAAMDSALFTEYALWQKNKDIPTLKLSLRVKDALHEEAGIMLLLLRELWNGSLPLGGEKSIGRGVLQGITVDIYYENRYFQLKQKLPLQENYGKIKLKGINGDQQNLVDEDVKIILQSYVTELANYMANGQVSDHD